MSEQLDQFQNLELQQSEVLSLPRYRTFHDRETFHLPVYKEVNTAENVVKPNLSLSIRDIFDRWQRNLPLDTMMRNGEFAIEKDDSDLNDDDWNGIDIDTLDPAEVYELGEQIASRLKRLSSEKAASDVGTGSEQAAQESSERDAIGEQSEPTSESG